MFIIIPMVGTNLLERKVHLFLLISGFLIFFFFSNIYFKCVEVFLKIFLSFFFVLFFIFLFWFHLEIFVFCFFWWKFARVKVYIDLRNGPTKEDEERKKFWVT